MRISLRQLAVLLLLVVLTATGCSRQPQQTANTLRYVLEAEPATLDPAKSTAIPESLAELQLFEGLTRLDAKDRPLPGVATQWEISADGLRYIFHLRPDARWSNGEALTAHDFVYSWRRALDPETASEDSYMLYALKNGQGFKSASALWMSARWKSRWKNQPLTFSAWLHSMLFIPFTAPVLKKRRKAGLPKRKRLSATAPFA